MKTYSVASAKFSMLPTPRLFERDMVFHHVSQGEEVRIGRLTMREMSIVLIVDKQDGKVEVIGTLSPVSTLKRVFVGRVGKDFKNRYGDEVIENVDVYIHRHANDPLVYAKGMVIAKRCLQAALIDKLISTREQTRVGNRIVAKSVLI